MLLAGLILKKLKERQSLLATELNKANDEIQRLKKLLNRSDDISSPKENIKNEQKKQNSVIQMYFDDDEEIIIKEDLNNLKKINSSASSSPYFNQPLFSAEQ
ncbi:Rap-GAP domain-containing protein [Meloidogyne graminicola]|uniref:Rap-GAP domain-containing protein n=1 Tax=Meloidogyne graminicola TaxID=189291 RepID=A0A8T0A374_9BILA|nr:Rap-GAP domain-containing protein [Meloidogyne graminicola]